MWHNRFYAMSGFIAVLLGIFNGNFLPISTVFHQHSKAPQVIPPVAICESFQTLTLNPNGQKTVLAVQLNNDSYDPTGGFLWFKIRRATPGPCGSDTLFRSALSFCCADVGDTIDVVLRVYNVPVDTGGVTAQYALANSSDCTARLYVIETVKPTIATLPNDTISCEFFLSGIYFPPAASDNCCLDTILKSDQYITYDTACKRGVVRRRFTAVDCIGNTASSTQTLTVVNEQFYVVQFPADAIVTGCADYSANAMGKPIVYEGSCEKMNLTYIDTFQFNNQAAGAPCLTILRTWRVFSWCHYSGSLPLTVVPNPNPNPYSLSPENLPAPTVGPQGIGSVMQVAYNDPAPTDFSTFWQQNVNGYSYTQIIRIYDQSPPGGRIASPSSYCDLTINDPNLWQGGNWYNPANGTNDLPDCPALLTLRGIDNCTVNDMSVYYELYLDLDNNDTLETFISSQNPPPSGSVNFGNLLPGGGTQRQFDRRIVGINLKYNFALERVITGDSMTARVKWNTTSTPTNYTTPQFPYGRHKLVWHLFDKCGNESVFTHWFTTSDDCEPPVITCLPDITLDLPSSGDSIYLPASNLIYNLHDNVTPNGAIQISIEKLPFQNHFPVNGVGNPVAGTFLGCEDLGFQPVRVWARDEFGNAAFCESVVAVDDPDDACTVFSPAISGAAYTMNEEEMGANFDLYEMPDTVFVGTSNSSNLGFYYFNGLTPFGNYFVKPWIDSSDLLNGVNTYDLVLISRHILNLEPLNSPYKLIAADINRSGTVTTFDIVTGRKAILGTITEFPNNTNWRVIPKNYPFLDPQNPFQYYIPEQMNFSSVFNVVQNADFYCVKVGDVDWTATPNPLQGTEDRTARTGLVIYTGEPVVRNGQEEIPLLVHADEPVDGFQFDLSWPEIKNIDFQSNTIPSDHYLLERNHLRMSWEFPVRPTGKDPEIGRLVVPKAATEWLSGLQVTNSHRFKSAAYSVVGQPLNIELSLTAPAVKDAVAGSDFSVTPTPFRNELRINFSAPGNDEARFIITDIQGRIITAVSSKSISGYFSTTINSEPWPPGIYICKMETANGTWHKVVKTVKM